MRLINKSIGVIFVVLISKRAYLARTYTNFYQHLIYSVCRLIEIVFFLLWRTKYIDHMECSTPAWVPQALEGTTLCCVRHRDSASVQNVDARNSENQKQPQPEKTARQRASATALLNGNLLPKAPKSRICFPRRIRALPHCSNQPTNKWNANAMFVLAERGWTHSESTLPGTASTMCHPEMRKKRFYYNFGVL